MKLFTQKELAKILNISYLSLCFYRKQGKINYYKIGGQYRFSEQHVKTYLESVEKK